MAFSDPSCRSLIPTFLYTPSLPVSKSLIGLDDLTMNRSPVLHSSSSPSISPSPSSSSGKSFVIPAPGELACGLTHKLATSFANPSGRTQSNLFDVVCALEELYSVQGFRSASAVNGTLLILSTLADIKFVNCTNETPFAKPVCCRNRQL